MKKIMFMINSLYGGGAEKVLQTILCNIDYQKYDVTLYSMHREQLNAESYPEMIHYRVVFDNYSGKSSVLGFLYSFYTKIKGVIFQKFPSSIFNRFFIHGKYDVEVAFIEGESTKIISGSANKKSLKIAWVHIDLLANPWTEFLYKSTADERSHYMKFNKICCVSEKVRESFITKFGDSK